MADQLETEVMKKLHMKSSESDAATKSSSSDTDEDVDRVEQTMAILSYEYSDDFVCSAGSHCQFEDPKSHPKGMHAQMCST